jgi:hypothetical protein
MSKRAISTISCRYDTFRLLLQTKESFHVCHDSGVALSQCLVIPAVRLVVQKE